METKTIIYIIWGVPAFFTLLFSLSAPMMTIFACGSMGAPGTTFAKRRATSYWLLSIYGMAAFQFGMIFPALHALSLGQSRLAIILVCIAPASGIIYMIVYEATHREERKACREHDRKNREYQAAAKLREMQAREKPAGTTTPRSDK